MSGKSRINILEDITIKASNGQNPISTTQHYSNASIPEHPCKENVFNVDCTTGDVKNTPRLTASMDLFEEEAVFSDSEEEREFTRRVLESQNISLVSNEKPKRISIDVQCDLPICDMQIREFVEKCSKLKSEEVSEEFKELIDLCRRLNDEHYGMTPALPEKEPNTSSHITELELKQQEVQSTSSKILPEFMPSREGSDNFLSENFQLGCSKINCLSNNEKSIKAVNSTNEECSIKTTKSNLTSRLRPRSTNINKNSTMYSKDDLEKAAKRGRLNRKGRKNFSCNTNTECSSHERSVKDGVDVTKLAVRRSTRLKQLVDMKNNPVVKLENMSPKQKVRRLYSPTQWVLSEEFASICEKV